MGSDVISGYYGDIIIDGPASRIKTEESEILPVNSNKRNGSNESSQVFISPTKL
jgi:hypothetical protein